MIGPKPGRQSSGAGRAASHSETGPDAVEVALFRLDADRPGRARRWVEKLGAYLNEGAAGGDRVTLRDGARPENAPWEGVPFILAGGVEQVSTYFRRLSREAQTVFADCAYFWILTDAGQEALGRQLPLAPADRVVVLDWNYEHQNVIRSQLADLRAHHARLAGLSRGLSRVRAEITRIAAGPKGPWTPTLILGESGTGKEEVARALYAASGLEPPGEERRYAQVACGWFTEELLQDQLFGHRRGAFTHALEEKAGLLESHSRGAVLLDDFDAAPPGVQGALLRVIAGPKGSPARIIRIGDTAERETGVWLLFSTNADVERLIGEGRIREDFIFRFEDRVIHVPPLGERPADIPAVARRLWDELWRGEEPARRRPLSAPVLAWLAARETRWAGNVRALRALLSLAASMARLPAHNHHSLRQILGAILARGAEYRHWVGIVATPSFTGPLPPGDAAVQAVLKLDERDDCRGPTRGRVWPATGSEREAEACLMPEGAERFALALRRVRPTKSGTVVRASVRLSRLLVYAARRAELDRHVAAELSGVTANVAAGDLKLLAAEGVGLLRVKSGPACDQATVYEPVAEFFSRPDRRPGH